MSKLNAAQINLLLAKMDKLDGDMLLKLQKEVEIRITKKAINEIIFGLIKGTKKIHSMEFGELDEVLETFENNPLIIKHKKDFKDLSIFYDIFDLICGISALEEDGSELETRYNDTIKALGLISKYDKISKKCVMPVKIPDNWNGWLKKRLSGLEADGRLLKKGKKSKKKSKKK